MLLSTKIAICSSIIAFGALAVSIASLWKTHLSKFNPVSAVGRIRHRIYPIKNEEQRWFISSFDIPLTITNDGARTWKILDLRLILHFPEIPIPNNQESIKPTFEISPSDARKIDKRRFEWIEEIVIGEWMPFIILPKKTIRKHIVFETRWDDPVIQNQIEAELELLTDSSIKWKKVCSWNLFLDAASWGERANRGTSFYYHPKGFQFDYGKCYPKDLHKYTGSKEEIPLNGYDAAPSYLDFPENKE